MILPLCPRQTLLLILSLSLGVRLCLSLPLILRLTLPLILTQLSPPLHPNPVARGTLSTYLNRLPSPHPACTPPRQDWKDAAAKTGPPKKASRAARAAPRKRGSGVSRGEEEDQGDTADEPSNATSTSAPSSSEAGQTSARRREEREDQVAIVEDVPNAFSAAARKSSSMAILKRISRPAKRSCGRQSPTKSRDKKRKQVAQPAHLDLLLARFCQRVVKACSCGAAGDMGS